MQAHEPRIGLMTGMTYNFVRLGGPLWPSLKTITIPVTICPPEKNKRTAVVVKGGGGCTEKGEERAVAN